MLLANRDSEKGAKKGTVPISCPQKWGLSPFSLLFIICVPLFIICPPFNNSFDFVKIHAIKQERGTERGTSFFNALFNAR